MCTPFRFAVEGLPRAPEASIVGFERADAPIEGTSQTDTVRAVEALRHCAETGEERLDERSHASFRVVVEDLSNGNQVYRDTTFRSAEE